MQIIVLFYALYFLAFIPLSFIQRNQVRTNLPIRFYALIVLTELRYESFTPNHIRVPKDEEKFSEPLQLCIHIAAFAVFQALPQSHPTVLAFEVQLAIYIIWTSLQLVLRYESSPPLFGPLYLAESLSSFWYLTPPSHDIEVDILSDESGQKHGTMPLHLPALL